MAKSKNGATEPGKSEDPKHDDEPKIEARKAQAGNGAVGAPLDAPAPQPRGRPRKQSRRGQGGGPKTKAGKAAVSRNAIKHGITSASPVIPGMESDEEWQAYRSGIIESLEPEGRLETVLAVRIAELLWRFDRVIRYETSVTAKGVEFEGVDAPDAEMWMLPTSFHLDRVMRYENHIHRQLKQTYNLLDAIMARRMGQPTHLTRLDISSSPQFRNTRAPVLSDAFANLN